MPRKPKATETASEVETLQPCPSYDRLMEFFFMYCQRRRFLAHMQRNGKCGSDMAKVRQFDRFLAEFYVAYAKNAKLYAQRNAIVVDEPQCLEPEV